jgi:hypothetical protein
MNIISPGTHFSSGLKAQSSPFFHPVLKERPGIQGQVFDTTVTEIGKTGEISNHTHLLLATDIV